MAQYFTCFFAQTHPVNAKSQSYVSPLNFFQQNKILLVCTLFFWLKTKGEFEPTISLVILYSNEYFCDFLR